MTDLYLIAHKVRGEPAFDIAQQMECPICKGVGCAGLHPEDAYEGPSCDECEALGYWWIIPTSGHRAHPIWAEPLNHFVTIDLTADTVNIAWISDKPAWGYGTCSMPDFGAAPDHYPTAAEPRRSPTAGRGLLARLGLLRAQAPIKRRV